jgi:DNA-binding XRE family transcriptional regulator
MAADAVKRTTIEIMGERFVLIPEAELAAIEGTNVPPIAEDGTCEALPFVRASIARDIIRERTALGLTQAQLAKLAGIRQETLSRLESGKHKPNVRTIERIEAALKRKRSLSKSKRNAGR